MFLTPRARCDLITKLNNGQVGTILEWEKVAWSLFGTILEWEKVAWSLFGTILEWEKGGPCPTFVQLIGVD